MAKIGDRKILTRDDKGNKVVSSMSKISKEYPELAQMSFAIGEYMARAVEAKARAAVNTLHSQLSDMRFWTELTDPSAGIPDARQIAVSPEFQDWIKKQSPEVRKLYESPKVAHAKLVIRKYKNDVAKAKARSADEKARKRVGLRGAAARDGAGGAGGGSRKSGKGGGDSEFDSEFDKD